jgi:peptidoglycan/LPS O-acetylase OafA/YrhL
MYKRLSRRRAVPVALGLSTLLSVAAPLTADFNPQLFPAKAHEFLAALPLTAIAIAYLLYQSAHRPLPREFAKAILLALAFLFWAANQFWPDSPQATLFNDVAITLFVLDVFLVIIGWPKSSPDESFADTPLEGP